MPLCKDRKTLVLTAQILIQWQSFESLSCKIKLVGLGALRVEVCLMCNLRCGLRR